MIFTSTQIPSQLLQQSKAENLCTLGRKSSQIIDGPRASSIGPHSDGKNLSEGTYHSVDNAVYNTYLSIALAFSNAEAVHVEKSHHDTQAGSNIAKREVQLSPNRE